MTETSKTKASELPELRLATVGDVQYIKGVPFPPEVKFRQLIVTGPPGSGKSKLILKLGGWPEEGFIDLTLRNWWSAQSLTFRPREVHLGFPFVGHDDVLTVFDKEFLEAPETPALAPSRMCFPPAKTHFFSTNWSARFVFEFLIPPPEDILKWRLVRSQKKMHPVDEGVTLDQVNRQSIVYHEAALHFQRAGLMVYIRDEFEGIPKKIVEPEEKDENVASSMNRAS